MKPVLPIVAIGCVLAVHGQARAEAPRIGASLDYHEVMQTFERSGRDITDHYDAVGGTLFADWNYLRLGLGASHNYGNMIIFADGGEEKDPGYSIAYLHASAVLKHPFELYQGALTLWPALGLRGDYNLTYEYSGTGNGVTDSAAHDLTVLAGGGLDYAIGSRFALTASLLGGYCLTPSASDDAKAPRIFDVSLSAGVLLRL